MKRPEMSCAETTAAMEQLKRELAVERNQFRGAFESSAIGMAIVGLDGKWIQVNESLLSIVGYSREELYKLTFQDITHPDDLQADLELAGELVNGKRDNYQLEKRYFHRNGQVVWILLSVSMVRDTDGRALHFVSQVVDITKAKKISHLRIRETDKHGTRIALELHENIAQALASIKMYLSSSLSAKIYRDRDLTGVDKQLASVIEEVRNLTARITPTTFLHENIKTVIEDLALKYHLQHNLQVQLSLDESLTDENFHSNYHIFRIVENHLKLALVKNATTVKMEITSDKMLHIIIEGNDETTLAESQESLLLEDIKARVEILNGVFRDIPEIKTTQRHIIVVP